MADYTTTALIASIKRRITAATSGQLYQDADYIAAMNEAQREMVVPEIKRARQQYFVTFTDTTLVAGTAVYGIPPKAIAGSLTDVKFVDASGSESPLAELAPSQAWAYGSVMAGMIYPMAFGVGGYYLRDTKVVLQPVPRGVGTLRLKYERRRNELVLSTAAAQVTNVNTGTNQLTLSAPPSSVATIGAVVDVIEGRPPFNLLADAVTISAVAGAVITIPSVTGISVGDWVAVAGESPIPLLPYEAHDLLAQGTAVKVEESSGKAEFIEVAQKRYEQIREAFVASFVPRNIAAARKIVNINGVF